MGGWWIRVEEMGTGLKLSADKFDVCQSVRKITQSTLECKFKKECVHTYMHMLCSIHNYANYTLVAL